MTKLVVPLDSVWDEARFRAIRIGERLSADDPFVKANPDLFVSADLPDGEIGAARARYFDEVRERSGR